MKKIMKFIIIFLCTLIDKNLVAQKNGKIELPEKRGNRSYLEVSTKSRTENNKIFYEARFFVPTTNNPIRLDVKIENTGATYGLQVERKNKILLNASISTMDTVVYLPAAKGDTITFFFLAASDENNSLQTYYSIIDIDTTITPLASSSEKIFHQVIQSTSYNFVPLLQKNELLYKVKFSKGLFHNAAAGLDERNWVWQRTGYGLTVEESSADIAKWAKQLKKWLKKYSDVTETYYDSQKIKNSSMANSGYKELYEFIKKDKNGKNIMYIRLGSMQDVGDGKLYNEIKIYGR
jgi:hypothetical protein